MARQPALNEEALVKLGSEKLARLVIGEAKRNAAFRKLVAAALAAPKGPAAVAAIIDKRLAGLDRAKAFVDWEKAKAFTADIAATLPTEISSLFQQLPKPKNTRRYREDLWLTSQSRESCPMTRGNSGGAGADHDDIVLISNFCHPSLPLRTTCRPLRRSRTRQQSKSGFCLITRSGKRLAFLGAGNTANSAQLRFGWGTWIRTKIDGVRVRCSTVQVVADP
jgi:hypothetical protein